jgi:hypothetical protein
MMTLGTRTKQLIRPRIRALADRDFLRKLAIQLALRALLYASKEGLASSPPPKERRCPGDGEDRTWHVSAIDAFVITAESSAARDL